MSQIKRIRKRGNGRNVTWDDWSNEAVTFVVWLYRDFMRMEVLNER